MQNFIYILPSWSPACYGLIIPHTWPGNPIYLWMFSNSLLFLSSSLRLQNCPSSSPTDTLLCYLFSNRYTALLPRLLRLRTFIFYLHLTTNCGDLRIPLSLYFKLTSLLCRICPSTVIACPTFLLSVSTPGFHVGFSLNAYFLTWNSYPHLAYSIPTPT